MTAIYYNGVILRDCETREFNQTIEYDESNTDVINSQFRIRVASTLTAYHNPPHASTIEASGMSVVERAADIHAKLSEARKDFWMVIEGAPSSDAPDPGTGLPVGVDSRVLLIASGSTNGLMLAHPEGLATVPRESVADCDNGPKPISVNVTQIIGGRAMRVEFEIVVCRKICTSAFIDADPEGVDYSQNLEADNRILSNRWSLEESKDESWITSKTLQGTLRVRHSSFWPHAMRYLCIPSLLNGYRRVRQSFVDDPNGLVLKYRIEDRQFHASPPPPAIDWTGHHMETSTENGSIQGSEVQIRLVGPPGVDKLQLIGAAGKVLVSRIRGLIPERDESGNLKTSDVILQNAALMDVMHESAIQLRAQVMYNKPDYKWLTLRVQDVGRSMANLARNPNLTDDDGEPVPQPYAIDGYHPRVWPAPRPYDSATPSGIFSCYLQHPCSVWHDVPNGQEPGAVLGTQETQPPSRTETGEPDKVFYLSEHTLPADTTDLAPQYANDPVRDVYSFPYTVVEIQNRYVTDHGWVRLPYATVPAAGQPSALLTRMHGSVCRRILTMTASREGLPPVVPPLIEEQIDPNGIREVLESDEVELIAPVLHPGGQGRRYSVRILYSYLLDRAPTATEKLRTGASPLDKLGAGFHHFDRAIFSDSSGHLQSGMVAP